MDSLDLSVVLPVFNEEGNLRPLNDELTEVLASLAPGYFMMMAMMRQSIDIANLADALNGRTYRIKCLLALKAELAALSEDDRHLIEPTLRQCGAWEPLQFQPGESEHVVAIEMA